MRVLLIVLGVVAILAALFAGGCSLFFVAVFLQQGSDDPYVFWPIPLSGLALSSFFGWLGWLALRGAKSGGNSGDTPPPP
jgi:hypothetical protein